MDNVIQFPRTFAVGTLDGMTARKDEHPSSALADGCIALRANSLPLSQYVERREGAAQTIVVYLA